MLLRLSRACSAACRLMLAVKPAPLTTNQEAFTTCWSLAGRAVRVLSRVTGCSACGRKRCLQFTWENTSYFLDILGFSKVRNSL